MSIHSSLRGADTLSGERSVLTRMERLQKLAKEGRFDLEAGSVWGIPKVRTKFKVSKGKKKPAKEDAESAPAAEGGEDAPAEGASDS